MNALRRHRALTRIWASDPGWKGWFTTVNHTDLGRMFLATAAFFFVVGGILAMLIRAQLATPRSAFLGPEHYNQIFTMHGTIMMFLFAIPFFEGLAVYLLPKLLGTRDLAFPRLTAYGFWCYVFGGAMMIAFWGAVIVLVVFAVRWISASQTRARDDASAQSSSLRILEERYARGDLDHDEFERRRQVLLRPGTTV